MKPIYILLTFLIITTSCNSQNKDKITEDELRQLIEREKKNEERAKYGGSNSDITVISNPKNVARLKTYISNNNTAKKKLELEKAKNKSLFERYKSDDKSVVPEIITVLNSDDIKAKKELYRGLSRRYDQPDSYTISEPELATAILNNITIPEDEKSVIQLAGYMAIEGYTKVFENRLLSGKSKDDNRLIFWLGKAGKSEKTLNYIETLVFSKKFNFEDYDYTMSALEGFSENGTAATKQKAFDICLKIYNEKLIPKEDFEAMQSSWSSTNPAINLTNILLDNDDKRVIPIAKDFLKKDIRKDKALSALVRLEGKTHKPTVLAFLKNEDTFFDGLYPATLLYNTDKDNTIVETILTEFEKRDEHPNYDIEKIVSTLKNMKATSYFDKLNTILKDKNLIDSISKAYDLSKSSVETIAKDLLDFGVIDQPISEAIITKAKEKNEDEYSDGDLYNLLSVSGIHLWFDAETGFVPVDYDNLIRQFSENSNGKLNTLDVWMDADVDKDYNVKYKIYVYANNNIYIMAPEDIGDWYDVNMTLKLMNTIAKDAKLSEEFVFVDTGDQTAQILFGPKENVERFVKKYNM